MKIALAQMDILWESKKENYKKAEVFIKRASKEACNIIVFPEMFNTGFSMSISSIAEDMNGETASLLSELAKKYAINLIAGFSVKSPDKGKGRNLAVAYDRKGSLIMTFTKLHSFTFAREDKYYVSGEETVVFNIEGMSSSLFICYDLRFPEIFRSIAKRVQVVFIIANWPSSRKEHWETLLKARAIENQCFVIGVNRAGTDGKGLHYSGASHIFDPSGDDICSGSEEEELLICEFDPLEVREVRSKFPFLHDIKLSSN